MITHYKITRGMRRFRNLSPAQRCSSLFAEEPVVMGKTLRAGSGPLVITAKQFEANKVQIERLIDAGSIVVRVMANEAPPADPPKVIVPPVKEEESSTEPPQVDETVDEEEPKQGE